MNERAKLLHSLTIERADTKVSPPRRRLWPVVAATSFGVVTVMLALAGISLPEIASLRPVEQAAAVAPAASPPPAAAATATAAEAARSGGLVASGYVVARRKATVAAEITGKVVEVLVDEGNVVRGGQTARPARQHADRKRCSTSPKSSGRSRARPRANAIAAELRDAERILARTQAAGRKKTSPREADLTKARRPGRGAAGAAGPSAARRTRPPDSTPSVEGRGARAASTCARRSPASLSKAAPSPAR